MAKIKEVLGDQSFLAFLLFLLLVFIGGLLSGSLELHSIDVNTVQLHIPFFTVDYAMVGGYGVWIGILASSATLAAFLGTYVGKHLFMTYKVVDYPADHLKMLRFIKAEPRKVGQVAEEFDVPPSVAKRVLDDLGESGLLEVLGEGEKAVYYFPFDKERAKEHTTE